MTGFLDDLRYGLRALRASRAFTAVAVLSLALGIGANATIFTLIRALLLRPLPVRDAATLIAVHTFDARNPGYWGCSYPNYKDYRDQNQVFSSLLLYAGVGLNLTGGAEPRLVMGQLISANYFATVGLEPALGRGFTAEEETSEGAFPVAIVGYRFWQQEFGGDPQVTNRKIELNGRAYHIVGVAPEGFEGLDTFTATEIWVPLSSYPQLFPAPAMVNQRRALLFWVVGRLKPGVTLPHARAAMRALGQSLERQFPADNHDRSPLLLSAVEAALPPEHRDQIQSAGFVLAVISAVVLAIACGNVAGLLLARGAARSKEIAIRMALGSSSWRLIRQFLTESLVLGLLGGGAGLLVAAWARNVLWALRPPMFRYAAVRLDLDGQVIAYTLGISLLSGLVFGLVPALRYTRADLATDLKERTGLPPSFGGRWNLRSLLVMAQIAFSVVALVGAGLFVRSLRNAARFQPGFDADHLGIVVFNVADQGYSEARGRVFQQLVLERASAVPGVAAATLAKDWPFLVSYSRTMIIPGRENPENGGHLILAGFIWPGYLRSVGTPLLRGREFTPQDGQSAPRVAIVNLAAAKRYWPGEDPIGKRVQFFRESSPVEVIGVASDANYQALGERPQPFVYFSMLQYYFPTAVLYVRTAGDPEPVLASVRREVQALDHNLLLQAESTRSTISQSLWAQRMSAGLLAAFGLVALLLASIGIYGVISYSVAQRRREFGIRMALGATGADVQGMLVRESIRLVAIGVTVGTLIALAASRAVQHMLFVTNSLDAVTFILVPSMLVLAALLACWLPARRAVRVDPAVALREN